MQAKAVIKTKLETISSMFSGGYEGNRESNPENIRHAESRLQDLAVYLRDTRRDLWMNVVPVGDFAEIDDCLGGVAPGSSCTVTVKFKPSATGQRVGKITFNDNDQTRPQAVTLTGAGI